MLQFIKRVEVKRPTNEDTARPETEFGISGVGGRIPELRRFIIAVDSGG